MANEAAHAVEHGLKQDKPTEHVRQQATSIEVGPVTLDSGLGSQPGTAWMDNMLLRLQGAAGNAAVAQLLASQAGRGTSVQRAAETPTVQRRVVPVQALTNRPYVSVQRDGGHPVAEAASPTALDDVAKGIIAAARATKPGIEARADDSVWAIINAYYPAKKAMVSDLHYVEKEDGLRTKRIGRREKATGSIAVGKPFIEGVDDAHFARRVLQVGHELEHCEQFRQGMMGKRFKREREFLAFYHEGIAPAVGHTGRMAHAMRVDLLDQAIRNYNGLSDDKKREYAGQYQDLLNRRTEELHKAGKPYTDPPTEVAPDKEPEKEEE